MIVVVSCYPERVAANAEHWGEFTVFETRPVHPAQWQSIRFAYLNVCGHAIREGWDESVVVIQDDTAVTPMPHVGDVTSYHPAKRTRKLHVCPRAFSATPTGWLRLAEGWMEGALCTNWTPDHIYDSTHEIRHLAG